jgi:RNA polymerase sigma factor for flagellar operon FliA
MENAMTFTHGGNTDPLSENEVRNELIVSALPLVHRLARRIHQNLPKHILLEDLVNVGVLGLIEAAGKYSPGKHASLRSFASFRISGAIVDSLRGLDWGSRSLRTKGRNVAESINKLKNKLGRQPAQEEIARDLDLEISELHKLLWRLNGLNIAGQTEGARFDDFESRDLVESAPGDEKEIPFELCLHSERIGLLNQAIETLSEKEQAVILLYYREELSMREVGEVMELVGSRVSQIHSLAVRKLREAIKKMQVQEDSFH